MLYVKFIIILGPQPKPSGNPCVPSPCGPNSQCRVIGETPACSCEPGYVGRAPNCRPECIYDGECPSNLACVREKCINPCDGSCGSNTDCVVINHKAACHCREGYTGDPFRGCRFLSKCDGYFFNQTLFMRFVIITHHNIIFFSNGSRRRRSKPVQSFTLWT